MSIEYGSDREVEHLILGVPEQLQAYPQFVVWNPIQRHGKITKPPINPATGYFADTQDPSTWKSFSHAISAYSSGRYAGLGFVFSEVDEFCGIDLDHVIEEGTLAGWAGEIVQHLNSYSEISPSGSGIHVITQASLPEGGRRKDGIEMYDRGRYFTVSADHLNGTPDSILERQEAVNKLYASLEQTQSVDMQERTEYTLPRGDDEVIKNALSAKNGESFSQLWQGNTAGFKSKSEADFTLILRLLYWSNESVSQTRRLFLQSGLADGKSLRPTGDTDYLGYTINAALKKRRY